MILGHGDIASVLTDRDDRIYFASGVSNSSETRESEYRRELNLLYTLLSEGNKKKHLIYFSSLCVFYSDTRYARHKLTMEDWVRKLFPSYTIIRLGNITWGSNPNTLINFIKNKIKNREQFEVQDVYRYIVDKEELLHWIMMIPDFNCEINIPGKRMKVKDIVREYCYPWVPKYKTPEELEYQAEGILALQRSRDFWQKSVL